MSRRVKEVRKEGVLDRGLAWSPPTKGRKRDQEGGRSKKLKHPLMEDDWGDNEDDLKVEDDDRKPQEQRIRSKKDRGGRSGDQTSPPLLPTPPHCPLVGDQSDRQVSRD